MTRRNRLEIAMAVLSWAVIIACVAAVLYAASRAKGDTTWIEIRAQGESVHTAMLIGGCGGPHFEQVQRHSAWPHGVVTVESSDGPIAVPTLSNPPMAGEVFWGFGFGCWYSHSGPCQGWRHTLDAYPGRYIRSGNWTEWLQSDEWSIRIDGPYGDLVHDWNPDHPQLPGETRTYVLGGLACVGTLGSFDLGRFTPAAAATITTLDDGFTIRIEEPEALAVADFDDDGRCTVRDIFAFLTCWTAGESRADVNDDGAVGVPDIFTYLTAWFEGR